MAFLTSLRSFARRALRATGEAGASLVEYTLLVALIAAFAIGAIAVLGKGAKHTLCDAGSKIAAADASAAPDASCADAPTP